MKLLFLSLLSFCSISLAQGTIPSSNMGMPIPQVGVEPGPQWATDINNSLNIIDRHDHSPGSGVQITPDGINITKDLLFNSNNATLLRSTRYSSQGSPLSGPADLGAIYVSGVDLYYNDVLGNQVRITQNGSITGVTGSITGLVSPASASYSVGSQTFIWQSDVNTAASMDARNYVFRNSTVSSFGLTLEPPTLTSDYNVTLPLLPAHNSLMTIDTSGVITAGIGSFDQSTITSDGTTVKVPTGGITNTQIATNTILASNIANNVIGLTQLENSVLQWNSATFTITTPGFNVRVATTVAGTLGTSFHNASVVDGVTLATNDLILIKNQVTATEDGVYVVQVSGTPVRSTSYNTFTLLNYAGVHVTAGTANTGLNWFQNNILTSLADNQSWSQSSTQLWTVPANVNQIYVLGIGGGGGGGGTFTGGTQGGAGGGGAGAFGIASSQVTPADSVAITVGFKGLGGASNASGGTGQDSSILGSGVSITFSGGGGGGESNSFGANSIGAGGQSAGATFGGGGGGSSGPGGAGTSSGVGIAGSMGGGGGGAAGTGPGGSGGGSFYVSTRASGGAGTNGGGGGGSGFAIGGAGGAQLVNGSNAPTADSGAGGGGSGFAGSAHTGGNGANGKVTIYWLGHP